MQNPHMLTSVSQFIDLADIETFDALGATCRSAKEVCDTITDSYLSDLIYVEHDATHNWKFYRLADMEKDETDLSKTWPLNSKHYDSNCSCYKCKPPNVPVD